MPNRNELEVAGTTILSQLYLQIDSFFIKGKEYFVECSVFIHSSSQVVQRIKRNCGQGFIKIITPYEIIPFSHAVNLHCMRKQNVEVNFLDLSLDLEGCSIQRMEDYHEICGKLENSLVKNFVVCPINLHVDDASMTRMKTWNSASVMSMQLAGAVNPGKGKDENNHIVCLTPTKKNSHMQSQRRMFEKIISNELLASSEGFECYDCFSGKKERIVIPVGIVAADLPSKSDVTPFIGHQGTVFCSRDMINKNTGEGAEVLRDLALFSRQRAEIECETRVTYKKELAKEYGLNREHLHSPLENLQYFDICRDLPVDSLHHVLLGWVKKSLSQFKKALSDRELVEVCAVLDSLTWKEYTQRTNKNALLKVDGQIGRSLRALMQVMWYPLEILICLKPEVYRVKYSSTLRVLFLLGKLVHCLHNEHQVFWTDEMNNNLQNTINTLKAFFDREFPDIIPGSKTHDLEYHLVEDIKRHGPPGGFSCQPGESQMMVQKLKNQFSNKKAPSLDVARKVMKTLVIRHIITGGKLSEDGSVAAGKKVVSEAQQFLSWRQLLGTEESSTTTEASLFDYHQRRLRRSRPREEHLHAGIPDEVMTTARKVSTSTGPLYRGGGLYTITGDMNLEYGILEQLYKSPSGEEWAVVRSLVEDSSLHDVFADETGIKILKKENYFYITKRLNELKAIPILHACSREDPVECSIVDGRHERIEESRTVEKDETHFNCIDREGNFFYTNNLCLSFPISDPFGTEL